MNITLEAVTSILDRAGVPTDDPSNPLNLVLRIRHFALDWFSRFQHDDVSPADVELLRAAIQHYNEHRDRWPWEPPHPAEHPHVEALISCAKDGATFELAPSSRQLQKLPRIFIAFDDQFNRTHLSCQRLRAVVTVLTGLLPHECSATFRDPSSGAITHHLAVEPPR